MAVDVVTREVKSGITKMSTEWERAAGPRGVMEWMYWVVRSREKYILRETPTVRLGL